MSNLNEKRVKALLKGNVIVDKAIKLMKDETANKSCTIRSFHNTAKQMLEVKNLLSSPKFKNELKKAEVKGMDNIKKLVPIVLGISYTKFARELQVAKVTITQLNAFIKAVKEDESISVSKQGLLAFVKGKKRVKTESVKPTAEPTNEGGKEETKEGGKESNIIFGCHFTPFGLVEAKGSLKITKEGGIENSDKLSAEQLMDIRNALKFAEAYVEKLLSTKTVKRVKK